MIKCVYLAGGPFHGSVRRTITASGSFGVGEVIQMLPLSSDSILEPVAYVVTDRYRVTAHGICVVAQFENDQLTM